MTTIESDQSGHEAPKRKRGRPRDPGADRRILDAARAVAAEVGIQGASMSAIADRSGVGKPTIYLRWPHRRALMVAAVADLRAEVAPVDTGSVRDDLVSSLLEDRDVLVSGPDARFLRSVLFESASDEELAQELDDSILAPRRRRLIGILERAATGGQIRGGIDPDGLADLLTGPLLSAMVVGGGGVDDDALARHVAVMVEGIGAGDRARAPRR
ncbi:TetR/AcrR family transcriptional regulator [Miltoncostaea marina]|uniref:TetR/AcrR family transcriptional regulator n=1 Tax=Miltoncostaea marina TaxID=2843215 RepID=UPI001C3C8870|nr:TetR/AcrR family transcriptional regulator [Miltoncostaea marina]